MYPDVIRFNLFQFCPFTPVLVTLFIAEADLHVQFLLTIIACNVCCSRCLRYAKTVCSFHYAASTVATTSSKVFYLLSSYTFRLNLMDYKTCRETVKDLSIPKSLLRLIFTFYFDFSRSAILVVAFVDTCFRRKQGITKCFIQTKHIQLNTALRMF